MDDSQRPCNGLYILEVSAGREDSNPARLPMHAMRNTKQMKPDNTVRNILIVAAIFFALAFASIAVGPFLEGVRSSMNAIP